MLSLAREHPGLVLTLAYLAATGVGILYSWSFYQRFGIDVFLYAQLQDFILVMLRTPAATLAVLLAGPVVWFILWSDEYMASRFSWWQYLYINARVRGLSRSRGAFVVYFVLYAFVFSILYSASVADRVRSGDVQQVMVQLVDGHWMGREASESFEAGLLGATSGYLFLIDAATQAVGVVPLENLAVIRVR